MTLKTCAAEGNNLLPRKITPTTASKIFKEHVRNACLERARRRRRQEQQQFRNTPQQLRLSFAQDVVADELQRLGIIVGTASTYYDYHQTEPDGSENIAQNLFGSLEQATTDASMVDDDSLGNDDNDDDNTPKAHHFISEEDLFQLLEEVEQELMRVEVECFNMQAENEEQYWMEQIAEYERWEEEHSNLNIETNEQTQVICPICQEEYLLETASQFGNKTIVCPNHMDGSCSMQLVHCLDRQCTRTNLCERIRCAFEQHAVYCCGQLDFKVVQQQPGSDKLIASCNQCGTVMTVI
jgi:hypothetical protein